MSCESFVNLTFDPCIKAQLGYQIALSLPRPTPFFLNIRLEINTVAVVLFILLQTRHHCTIRPTLAVPQEEDLGIYRSNYGFLQVVQAACL